MIQALLGPCKANCQVCAVSACPYNDPGHFDDDGCDTCHRHCPIVLGLKYDPLEKDLVTKAVGLVLYMRVLGHMSSTLAMTDVGNVTIWRSSVTWNTFLRAGDWR